MAIPSEILETMADGVILSDAAGRIVCVNGPAERLTGYPAADLIGRRVESLVPPHLRQVHGAHRERYLESPVPRAMGTALDIRLRRRDGTEIPVDIALSSLDSGHGLQAVAVVRDARAARDAQRAMAEQAHLLELAHDGILVRRASDSAVTFWSQGAVEAYGYSRSQALGRVSHDLLQTTFPDGADAVDRELRERGRWEGELQHTREDGSTIIVSSRQVLMRGEGDDAGFIFEINRDITEERRARDRLEAVGAVAQVILAGQPADRVLELVTHHARELAGAALATAALAEPGGEWLAVRAAEGSNAERLLGMRLPAGSSISGRAMTSRLPVMVADLSSDPDVFSDFALAAGMGPAIFVPLVGRAESLGTLMLGNPRGRRPFRASEGATLELFATAAAVALEYGRARESLERMMLLQDRERIARDLHDGAIQALFALGMHLQHTALLSREPPVSRRLEENVTTIDAVIRDLRGYVFGLRPALLRDRGLHQALDQLVHQFERESGVSTALEIETQAEESVSERSADVLQMAVEALSNVRKHAEALTCRVSLRQQDGRVILQVEDDGRGFDLDAQTGEGHGLRNFRERAERLGGSLTVRSVEDGGTEVMVTIPV